MAKLAGLPARALKSAHKHLNELKAQAAANRPQMDIFNMMPSENDALAQTENELAHDTATRALMDELAALQPDDLSPREALEALYRLKGLAKSS